jgi:NPCBM/NEW2 domain
MRKLVAAGAMALGIATLPVTAAHAGPGWIVAVKASATTVNVGQKVTFTGTVRPRAAAAGLSVVLQEKSQPGAPWKDQVKDKINRRGKYSLADTPTKNTLHAYRVVMPATDRHAKGVSKTVKVNVYDWVPLVSLDGVNAQEVRFGSVDINGTTYKDSVTASYAGSSSSIEFNLDHQCDKLRSTFGISDDSTTGGQAEVGVLSDGTSVYDTTFDLGQSEKRTVSLDKPLKIKLLAADTTTDPTIDGYGAFGDPQVRCTQ